MALGKDPYNELAALVLRAQAGDTEAFRELYRRTAQAQYFNLSAKVGADAAADLLQEVYLIAWQNIGSIDPLAFVGYVRTVAHNACLRYWDSPGHARETALSDDDLAAHDARLSARLAREADDPATVAAAHDSYAQLAQALREVLDEREREVILLRFYQEMRIDAIAEALEVSPSTVKRTIRRALNKLRARLGDLPRGAAFPVLLAHAVETPLAHDVAPKTHRAHGTAFDWAVRAMAALSAAAVIACVGIALAMERPAVVTPETIGEAAVPTSEPVAETAPAVADTTGPELVAMATERRMTVLTLTDESGIAAVHLVDERGDEYDPVAMEKQQDGAAGIDAGGERNESSATHPHETLYRFDVTSGTYTVIATDAAGNTASGPITVTLPPAEPVSISE